MASRQRLETALTGLAHMLMMMLEVRVDFGDDIGNFLYYQVNPHPDNKIGFYFLEPHYLKQAWIEDLADEVRQIIQRDLYYPLTRSTIQCQVQSDFARNICNTQSEQIIYWIEVKVNPDWLGKQVK